MWYEILPAATIIYVAFTIPTIGMYAIHKTFLGNAYRRDLRFPINRNIYIRNRRLTDNPYLFNGLETIDDGEACPCKCKLRES